MGERKRKVLKALVTEQGLADVQTARILQLTQPHRRGYCRDCGEKIAAARMDINPDALRCLSCQVAYEQPEAIA
ncbi:MAG: TraR/DksA C4-type zinc finger protein [Planctomycetes bacterium]|nr:TraR/DksA C4-type zinc finger protein [Planctomycetota bacterium]